MRKQDYSRFLVWLKDRIESEVLAEGTRKHRYVIMRSLMDFGINEWADITTPNIIRWDSWLRSNRKGYTLSATTVHNYHKIFKKYVRLGMLEGYLSGNPYEGLRFKKGLIKERRPLTEEELVRLREKELVYPVLQRARDLFVFAAYTGLAFSDVMSFDFDKATFKDGDLFYIDGMRLKTGQRFLTPILPPAMEVLKRYGYSLPRMSNQKLNMYLHIIETYMGFNKPMTYHVARHTFATLALSHNVPIEKVSRMLGHRNIRTTQIYAKIMKEAIVQSAEDLAACIK